jgi:HPt (histidine-containing phosphotransfer) domain-containing protein
MEQRAIEREIKAKSKEWVDDYGAEFLVEIIDAYLEDTPKRLEDLRAALAGGDNDTLTRAAHTLKSSCANVGAMSMAALAKEIEAAARQGDNGGVGAKAGQIQQDYQLVKLTLETLRQAAATNTLEL